MDTTISKGGVKTGPPSTKDEVAEATTHPKLAELKAFLERSGVPTAHILDRHLVALLNAGKPLANIVDAYQGYLAAGGGDDYLVFVQLKDGGQDIKDALLGNVSMGTVTRNVQGATLQARTFSLLAERGATPETIVSALGF